MKKTITQILIVVVSAAIVAEASAIISIEVRLARIETALTMHLQQPPTKVGLALTNPNP